MEKNNRGRTSRLETSTAPAEKIAVPQPSPELEQPNITGARPISTLNGAGPQISDCKLQANRANAKKSTGPLSPEGKAISRFNALSHGLCAKHIMAPAKGESAERIQQLGEALREKYGSGDIAIELLLETTLVDYWRNGAGLEFELECLKPGRSQFAPQGCMPVLQRYLTANRNALLKDVQLLEAQRMRNTEEATQAAE
jgi:hypothetical protein